MLILEAKPHLDGNSLRSIDVKPAVYEIEQNKLAEHAGEGRNSSLGVG